MEAVAARAEASRVVIRFVVDSSALWRIVRERAVRNAWEGTVAAGAVGSCAPQRVEFRRSARNLDEFEQMGAMFDQVYPDLPVPKAVWRWVDTAQYRLLRAGAHRAMSAVDLLVCGVAAGHGCVVLHDDNDFETAARHLPDVRAWRIVDVPPPVDDD